MGNLIVKIHKGPDGSKVIAICDQDILGNKIEEGDFQLDLSSNFYKGEEMEKENIIKEIKKGSCSLNIVGKESVEFCSKNNLVEKGNIIEIKGIPHAQAVIVVEE